MELPRPVLPLLMVSALFAVEHMISEPSCAVSGRGGEGASRSGDLKVMMVADLLLLGSDGGYVETFFRDSFMSKFFRKSLEKLKPDMIVVLGDISAKGWQLTGSKWLTVLQQFHKLLGPAVGLPLHIALGDRDIGECSKLDKQFVRQVTSNIPGLSSSGCSSFEIGNISFASINAVSLLCGNNHLRFSVEKVVERESSYLRNQIEETIGKISTAPLRTEGSDKSYWKDNQLEPHSGPVLFLHFPLFRNKRSICDDEGICTYSSDRLGKLENSKFEDVGPYELEQTLPINATKYLLEGLKPRIVFSAHSHNFYEQTHSDGTREVTVPAMTWAAGRKPGFVFASFGHKKAVSIRHCSFASERLVILSYFFFMLSIPILLVTKCSKFVS